MLQYVDVFHSIYKFIFYRNLFSVINVVNDGLMYVVHTLKSAVILPNFLVWKICGRAHFLHSFGQITQGMRKLRHSTEFPHQ